MLRKRKANVGVKSLLIIHKHTLFTAHGELSRPMVNFTTEDQR
jgi:hypothetical protein